MKLKHLAVVSVTLSGCVFQSGCEERPAPGAMPRTGGEGALIHLQLRDDQILSESNAQAFYNYLQTASKSEILTIASIDLLNAEQGRYELYLVEPCKKALRTTANLFAAGANLALDLETQAQCERWTVGTIESVIEL